MKTQQCKDQCKAIAGFSPKLQIIIRGVLADSNSTILHHGISRLSWLMYLAKTLKREEATDTLFERLVRRDLPSLRVNSALIDVLIVAINMDRETIEIKPVVPRRVYEERTSRLIEAIRRGA